MQVHEAHDPPDLELHASRDQLQVAAKDLGLFLAGSEDVFLDAGRRIAGLEQRARSLVDGARAVGAFRSDGAEEPAVTLGRELSRLVQHLRGSQEKVGEGSRQLGGLVGQIEILLRTQSHFESIPSTLRMLGLNTRIENARSTAQYAGMESVATEVRRLGDEVEPKFRGVFAQATTLLETVGQALDTAQGFLQGQDAGGGDTLGETQAALDALQATSRAGAEIADRAVAASERLTRDVGALLIALQGHDATRQVVEHVVAELEELAADSADDDAGRAAWRARLAELAPVMAAQVGGARERFVASLDGLAASLRAISSVGAELSRHTERFVASGDGASAAALVRKSVDRATHNLLQHVAHEATTGESMGRVVTTVEEMGRSVKDILGIGSAVKIIALNALVETERAGQHGRVLAVLAQGIGALAGEVVLRTGEVSQALGEISTIAAALRSTAARGGAAEGEAIAGQLERLSVHLSELQRGLTGAVAAMHRGSRSLEEEVEALAARVAQARDGAGRLAEIEAALAALAAAGTSPGEADRARRARVFSRYTMESERAIHESVLSGGPLPAGPAPRPAPAAAGADQGTAGLGANVELF
jgi:methyl-accepting chemotaxis protein